MYAAVDSRDVSRPTIYEMTKTCLQLLERLKLIPSLIWNRQKLACDGSRSFLLKSEGHNHFTKYVYKTKHGKGPSDHWFQVHESTKLSPPFVSVPGWG